MDGNELVEWWMSVTRTDIEGMADKIVEYGGSGPAVDLIETGRRLADLGGQVVDDEEATELGIAFYLSSKVSRWFAAIKEGRRPSDDTLLDIVIYGMMARRNRAVGGWPIGRSWVPGDRPLHARETVEGWRPTNG
jgi:hypothetical protein